MAFGASMFSSSDTKKKHDNLSSSGSFASSGKQTKDERNADASMKSKTSVREHEDDVSSTNPTKLFSFVSKRNWAGAVKRCSGADKAEATKWIVEHNNDGSIRWRLLPIHQVSEQNNII